MFINSMGLWTVQARLKLEKQQNICLHIIFACLNKHVDFRTTTHHRMTEQSTRWNILKLYVEMVRWIKLKVPGIYMAKPIIPNILKSHWTGWGLGYKSWFGKSVHEPVLHKHNWLSLSLSLKWHDKDYFSRSIASNKGMTIPNQKLEMEVTVKAFLKGHWDISESVVSVPMGMTSKIVWSLSLIGVLHSPACIELTVP